MELQQLVQNAKQADADALEEICRRFDGLVKKYAFQQHMKTIGGEAFSEGRLAVVESVRLYKPELGVPFAGFVENRIKYALWNLFKKERRRWQQETSLDQDCGEDGFDLLEVLTEGGDLEEAAIQRDELRAVLSILRELPEKQQMMIRRTVLGESSLSQVAQEIAITPQAAHNLRKRGLSRLKKRLSGM